ncbi:MAG: hypothetical protein H0W78_11280 [Planctomycetes bacterium]|nr:hypothetical protein [Planctomycetota bacterium]
MLGLHRLTAWDRAASRQCNRINHHRTGDIFAFVSHSSVGEERPLYLNSGDWVENGTALKYAHGQ